MTTPEMTLALEAAAAAGKILQHYFHAGVEVQTGDFFHYLHHRYFECNYGGDGPVMLDKVFGTFHNGTDEATEAMNERFLARAKQKQAGGG